MDKQKVLEALTKEYQTTNTIAKKLRTYHGAVLGILYELTLEDKVEKLSVGRETVWRLK